MIAFFTWSPCSIRSLLVQNYSLSWWRSLLYSHHKALLQPSKHVIYLWTWLDILLVLFFLDYQQEVLFSFFKALFIHFRERGKERGREREREQHQCEREASIGCQGCHCLPYVPNQVSNLPAGHVPSVGIEPRTFWCTGLCSHQSSHTGQGGVLCFKPQL